MSFVVIASAYITAAVSRELLRQGKRDEQEWRIEALYKSSFILDEQILRRILHTDSIPRIAQSIAFDHKYRFGLLREVLLRHKHLLYSP
jgi:hypothetical protein